MLLCLQFSTTLCTRRQVQQSFVALQFFQVEWGAGMWSSNLLVEVAMKFGVLLALPRNEVRKSPRNLASCYVLTCASDANKFIE